MKKRIAVIASIFLILVIIFAPLRIKRYDDGGTVEYSALAYKIVYWNALTLEYDADGNRTMGRYKKTSVYWFPDTLKSLSELYEIEMEKNQ